MVVNALAPMALAVDFIHDARLASAHRATTATAATTTTTAAAAAIAATATTTATVVNVSSGEGQLVFLNTALATHIHKLPSLAAWEELVRGLLLDPSSAGPEPAYGSSPWYSVSKALLNAGTALLHAEAQTGMVTGMVTGTGTGTRTAAEPIAQGGAAAVAVRAVAVCPGDFESPMTTAEERARMAAADHHHHHHHHHRMRRISLGVHDVVTCPLDFPGGAFYRPTESGTVPLEW